MKHPCTAIALAMTALAGCSSEPEVKVVKGTAVEHGKALFSDPSASPSSLNAFSCASCHVGKASEAGERILPGAPLAGVTERPTFWGGQENDLLRAINDCRFYFMEARDPWTAADEDARAMYAYLSSLPPESTKAAPFTVVSAVKDLTAGDAELGAAVFESACQLCHGAIHTGAGALTARATRMPDDPLAEHSEYSAKDQRVIFIEKIRHGGFLGYGGAMPPFSEEALSDEELAGLLSYLDLYED